MAEWVLRYADSRGEIHQQVANAASEQEAATTSPSRGPGLFGPAARRRNRPARARLQLAPEDQPGKFLIFNQQFVTLVRAGLPI